MIFRISNIKISDRYIFMEISLLHIEYEFIEFHIGFLASYFHLKVAVHYDISSEKKIDADRSSSNI